MNPCPFCIPGDDVRATGHAMVRYEINPVTPGHLLVPTRRHGADTPNPHGGVRGVIADKLSY
jgi:diadenosine tetraphosphate (Ap4A) HIT family hydrolase